jgi:hypothetical protein
LKFQHDHPNLKELEDPEEIGELGGEFDFQADF